MYIKVSTESLQVAVTSVHASCSRKFPHFEASPTAYRLVVVILLIRVYAIWFNKRTVLAVLLAVYIVCEL